MGDPKKLRKKYRTPSHPWQKLRIEEEQELMRLYGFKNKSEIWKIDSMLKDFKTQVKLLVPKTDEAAEKQKQQLITKVQKLNLLPETAVIEDILSLTLKDMCERRLQTLVVKKGLARSVKQARQFIVHDHIMIGEKKITSPNYVVRSDEELMIKFAGNSPYKDESHSERVPGSKIIEEEKQKAGLVKKDIEQEILPEEPVIIEPTKEEPVLEEKPEKEKSAQEELKEEVEQEKSAQKKEEEK